MPSAYDLYSFFLSAEHLRGKSVIVHVESVTVEPVFNPRTKRPDPRLVLRFHGKRLAMCLNKTQTGSMIDITGADDYTRWPGHTVLLTPATAPNGAQTITITAAPAPAAPGPAQPGTPDATDAPEDEPAA